MQFERETKTATEPRSPSRDARLWMALFLLAVFLLAGIASWRSFEGLACLFFSLGTYGPVAFILTEGYVAGKREEALGRVEAARIERERR